jgi:hypothetical protein
LWFDEKMIKVVQSGEDSDADAFQGRSSLGRMIGRVRGRMAVARFGRWWYGSFLVCAAVYGVGLLISRLLFPLPVAIPPWTLLAIPIVSMLAAYVGHRRVTIADGARAMDEAEGTRDLFLTAVLLEKDAPTFSGLVHAAAAARCRDVKPHEVMRWGCQTEVLRCVASLVILWLAMLWVPQLDPFGHVEVREKEQARREELSQTRKATEVQKARIVARKPAGKVSAETELRIEELKKTFASMDPGKRKHNFKALTKQQQELGKSWQRAKHASATLGALPKLEQAFGAQSPKSKQWGKQLAQGQAEGLKQELRELQKLARKLKGLEDGAERRALERELSRRLQELSKFAGDKMSSRALAAALSRGLSQLKMGGASELSQEAMEALAESLELAEMELSQLQQSMNDLQALEEALRTLQMAQQCNQQNPLDGGACTNGSSMASYAELYQQILAQQAACGQCMGCMAGTGCTKPGGGGAGMGMGGPGQGEGGEAPEDDSLSTDYVDEKSRSAMRAGKMLMEWQTDESADRGRATADYDRQIQELREGISEAVVNEGVPPVYHETIRRYFDSLAPTEDGTSPTAPDVDGEAQ